MQTVCFICIWANQLFLTSGDFKAVIFTNKGYFITQIFARLGISLKDLTKIISIRVNTDKIVELQEF